MSTSKAPSLSSNILSALDSTDPKRQLPFSRVTPEILGLWRTQIKTFVLKRDHHVEDKKTEDQKVASPGPPRKSSGTGSWSLDLLLYSLHCLVVYTTTLPPHGKLYVIPLEAAG